MKFTSLKGSKTRHDKILGNVKDNLDDADTNDDNEADDDCEITDVVTDEYGVIVLDDDKSVGDPGVVCDIGLPT